MFSMATIKAQIKTKPNYCNVRTIMPKNPNEYAIYRYMEKSISFKTTNINNRPARGLEQHVYH